jgi:hypothetical protein
MGFSQYYYIPNIDAGTNPGGLNTDGEYPVGGGLPAGWTSILSGPLTTMPAWSPVQNIPFTFEFNGIAVSSFKVSSSGVLTFSVGDTIIPPEDNETLPSASIPDQSICVWGIYLNNDDHILTKVFGNAPNRQLYIQFNSASERAIKDGWTYWSIVLEETTNNIYIVDQKTLCRDGSSPCTDNTSLTLGIQYTSTSALEVAGSPNIESHAGNSGAQDDNSYYEFIFGTQPDYDVAMEELDIPAFVKTNTAVSIKGTLKNKGAQSISTLVIKYKVNSGAEVEATLNGLNIAPGKTYDFMHTVPWTPTADGVYDITVWAALINGNADEISSNDEMTAQVEAISNIAHRMALHEVFTASTCPPCNPGNQVIDGVLDGDFGYYNIVKYQWYFPGVGDPYWTSECQDRTTYYGVTGVPRLIVDGGVETFNGNGNSYTQAFLDEAKARPAFIDIQSTYQISGQTVTVWVDVKPLKDFANTNMKLRIAVIERKTVNNKKTNGETEFFSVMKKMLPNAGGTAIGTLSKDVTKSYTETYTFPGNYRLPNGYQDKIDLYTEHSVEEFWDLAAVIWIQDDDNKDVLQSTWSWVINSNDALDHNNPAYPDIYPNPVNQQAMVSFFLGQNARVSFEVFNMLGQKVMSLPAKEFAEGDHEIRLNTDPLSAGAYMLIMNDGNKTYNKKFIK